LVWRKGTIEKNWCVTVQGDHSPDNVKFPGNSVMVCVMPPGH